MNILGLMTLNLERLLKRRNLEKGKDRVRQGVTNNTLHNINFYIHTNYLTPTTKHQNHYILKKHYVSSPPHNAWLETIITYKSQFTLVAAGDHCFMLYAFFKKVECLCMHGLHISEWSFNDAISGWKIIQYFSFRHRLQRFAAGLYAAPLSMILHLISYGLLYRL